MRLTGDSLKQLRDALLAAFNENRLRSMLLTELQQDLDIIVAPGPLETRVEDLIRWLEQRGRTQDLLTAAQSANPTNPQLAAVQLACSPDDADTAVPQKHTTPAGDTAAPPTTSIEAGHVEGAIIGGAVETGGGDFAGRDINKPITTQQE